MNEIYANYHSHLVYCGHAVGHVEDYVKEGIKIGLKEMGITDHCPIPKEWMTKQEHEDLWLSYQMDKNLFDNVYLKEIDDTIMKYQDKIHILKGIETEYFLDKYEYFKAIRDKLDYMVLGMHYFKHDGHYYSPYNNDFTYKVVIDYANYISKSLDTGLFKVLAHPDIFMYNYLSVNNIRRDFDSYAIKASQIIIEAAIRNNCYIEINANGIARGKREIINGYYDYLYPRSEFWDIVKNYKDVKIIINSDAHKVEMLGGKHIQESYDFANSKGLKIEKYLKL